MSIPNSRADILSTSSKRLRISRPKVRTGCLTCKARRIKCDETKPACERCTKYGRKCGGYRQISSFEERVAGRQMQNILPKLKSEPASTPPISSSSSTTLRLEDEFELSTVQSFCIETSLEICRFLDQPHWISTGVEICNLYSFLRHAYTAIRLLSKAPSEMDEYDPTLALITTISPHLLLDGQNPVTLHNERFSQGVQDVFPNGYDDSTKVRLVTIICLLNVCLAALQFQDEPALQHIQSGISLSSGLLDPARSSLFSTSFAQDIEFPDVKLDESLSLELVNLFSALDGMAMTLSGRAQGYTASSSAPRPQLESSSMSKVQANSERWDVAETYESAAQWSFGSFENAGEKQAYTCYRVP